MSGPQNPSQAVQDKQTELHMTGHKKIGTPSKIQTRQCQIKNRNYNVWAPKIPSQAVQDKQTELHMTGHKKMGTKQNPNQAVPNKKLTTCLGPKIPSQAVQDKQTELHMTGHKKMGTKKIQTRQCQKKI